MALNGVNRYIVNSISFEILELLRLMCELRFVFVLSSFAPMLFSAIIIKVTYSLGSIKSIGIRQNAQRKNTHKHHRDWSASRISQQERRREHDRKTNVIQRKNQCSRKLTDN